MEVPTEQRAIDLAEVSTVKEFCSRGCGCAMACTLKFSLQHIELTRANAAQLSRGELDMAIMGQVMAFTSCSQATLNSTRHRHKPKQRQKNRMVFYHNGYQVCRNTFLFLHNIGKFRLDAIKRRYVTEGMVPRIHHSGRTAPNALVLEDVRCILQFVMEYVETNGILLPGRIPGYKRDDIQLLPSSTTKRAVWLLYQDSAITLSARSITYSTFCVEEVSWSCGGLETHDRPLRDMPEEQCLYCPLHESERGGEIAGTCTCIHVYIIMTHTLTHTHTHTLFMHVHYTCIYMYMYMYNNMALIFIPPPTL